ncbi:MAG: chromosomal replication initiator DnaA [Pseudolabrys sp.]|nr:chromosomal replication initiator DnaA [Pseudolabrys sp.]
MSKAEGDLPWRNAEKLMTLKELPELCLGYGGNSTHGRRLAKQTRNKVLQTAKEIVDLGVDDPKLFSLIGLLEEGVGPDTIGDMTASAILRALVEITAEAAEQLGIKTKDAHIAGLEARLPFNNSANKSILLVPTDILRDLPVAADWSDISSAASENQQIRNRVNSLIGNIWKHTLKRQKDEIRRAALSNKDAFQTVLDAAYLLKDSAYDFEADPDGHRIFRETLAQFAVQHPLKLTAIKSKNAKTLRKVVDEILEHFKQLVEHNGINFLLWDDKKPRKEKAAQRLFFAVADVYCKANNVDISPECDSGGGPVDFKFSSGYSGRILVEIKLSTGKVVHGYTTQIGVYQKASATFDAVFLLIDVGGMGEKLKTILDLKNRSSRQGKKTADIITVDAKIKQSASKR